MKTRAALVGLVLLTGALAAADPSAEPDDVVKDRKAFFPWRKHGPLPGKVVGVLASDVSGFMSHEGRGGPPDAMGFSAGGESYRWVYVPVTEKPLITGLSVEVPGAKAKRVYPMLNMANAKEVERWGIKAPYSLVEAEVNDGKGALAGESFVGTTMTRLDGGKRYALDVTKALEEVKKRHAADLKGKEKAVARAIDDQAKKALKDKKLTGPRETRTTTHLTWLGEKETLRVAFLTKVTDGAFHYVEGGAGRLPPGGPGPLFFPPPPPPGFKVKAGTRIDVELGFAYEIDKAGKVVKAQFLPVEAKAEELSLPPGGMRGLPRGD